MFDANPWKAVTFGLCACTVLAASAQHLSFDDRKAELDAQTELLQKQLQLRDLLARLGGQGLAGVPSVLAIIGLDGKLNARLQHSSGVIGTYAEGEIVRPGMVVSAITPRSVIVKVGSGKGSRAVPLDFLAGSNSMPGMPGFPGVAPAPLPPEMLPAPPSVRVPKTAALSQPAAVKAPAGAARAAKTPAGAASAPGTQPGADAPSTK